jgi:hypothetical protein
MAPRLNGRAGQYPVSRLVGVPEGGPTKRCPNRIIRLKYQSMSHIAAPTAMRSATAASR